MNEDIEVLDPEQDYDEGQDETYYEDEMMATTADVVVPSEASPEQTLEEQKARAEQASNIEEHIKQDIAIGREALWDLSARLHVFHKMRGWEALGYETQEEWLAQPDIGMKRSTYMKSVRRFNELVALRGLPLSELKELDPSKVDIVLPTIASASNARPTSEIFSDVKTLGARDLRDEYVLKDRDSAPVVIEGKITDENESDEVKAERDAARKEADELRKAILTVDSWLELGGDRRNAKRAWAKVEQKLEAFQLAAQIKACIESEEDAPERAQAEKLWIRFAKLVGLDLSTETGA